MLSASELLKVHDDDTALVRCVAAVTVTSHRGVRGAISLWGALELCGTILVHYDFSCPLLSQT